MCAATGSDLKSQISRLQPPAYSLQSTVYSLQPTAYRLPPTAYSLTSHDSRTHHDDRPTCSRDHDSARGAAVGWCADDWLSRGRLPSRHTNQRTNPFVHPEVTRHGGDAGDRWTLDA